jgi:hypothetical protein
VREGELGDLLELDVQRRLAAAEINRAAGSQESFVVLAFQFVEHMTASIGGVILIGNAVAAGQIAVHEARDADELQMVFPFPIPSPSVGSLLRRAVCSFDSRSGFQSGVQ